MLKRWLSLLSVAAVALLVLTACGGDDDDDADDAPTSAVMATSMTGTAATMPAGGDTTGEPVTVTMLDTMKFEPVSMTVKAGAEVEIHLVNGGAIEHDFSLDESDVNETLDGGDETDFTFTAPDAPGTYTYFCNIPGHEAAGMKGELIVQ